MKIHHTKNKGDLGVLKAKVSLAEQGWLPLLPLTEHSSFDLAAYKEGKFIRIQVKFRTSKNGAINVSFRSSWSDKNGVHTKKVDKEEVDLYCVYCPDTNDCYWFDPKKFDESISLRIESSRNKQIKNIHFASDFKMIT
jgi:hypothetical protein